MNILEKKQLLIDLIEISEKITKEFDSQIIRTQLSDLITSVSSRIES